MEVVVNNEKLNKITFEVGDIVVWSGSPYLVLQRPTYCLASLEGDALSCGTYNSLEELIERVNHLNRSHTFDIKVYSKEDYVLNLERRG